MKLNTQFKAILVAIEENKTSDGKSSYYKLACVQGSEAVTISCTKDVFDMHPEPFKEYGFVLQIGEYEGKTTFRVTGIVAISGTSAHGATPTSAPQTTTAEPSPAVTPKK